MEPLLRAACVMCQLLPPSRKEALPLVTWARREWFTNEAAWDPEYPGLSSLADDLKARNFILLDYNKNVIGLEPMTGFLQRFKPPWAQDQN